MSNIILSVISTVTYLSFHLQNSSELFRFLDYKRNPLYYCESWNENIERSEKEKKRIFHDCVC